MLPLLEAKFLDPILDGAFGKWFQNFDHTQNPFRYIKQSAINRFELDLKNRAKADRIESDRKF